MRERFARLLGSFSSLATVGALNAAPLAARIRTLLEQFVECRDGSVTLEQTQSVFRHEQFRALLTGYNKAVERNRLRQEAVAEDFNLLDVMQLTGKEIRHSMVLAWLLDHDLRRRGTHAQGSLGFRLFLETFRLPPAYAACKYWVRREVVGDESIVDVEIACRGEFLIHIENKIWSHEGHDQTDREWDDIQRRAVDLNVRGPNIHALFLTPSGTQPRNPNFHAVSWGRVVFVLEAFADQAKPPDVKLFARHYARALQRFIAVPKNTGCDDGDPTAE